MTLPPPHDDTHTGITESGALSRFRPDLLVCPPTTKVSKTVINQTRWQARAPGSPLCVSVHGRYHDLCWWSGRYWTYICTDIP